MRLCFERENWYRRFGEHLSSPHCGHVRIINGVDYCPTDGNLDNYCYCGNANLDAERKVEVNIG